MTVPHVLILGGGFGGLAAANELRDSLPPSRVKITVIDKKDWFMVGFAKLWIIGGTRTFEDSVGWLKGLEKKGICFIRDEIVSINPEDKNVETRSQKIPFDFLIVSMGAALVPQRIPGLRENGLNLYDHGSLEAIRSRLESMESGKIAISVTSMPYKCPPAPFEAALLVDSVLRRRSVRDSIRIDFYSPAPITLPAAGPKVSRRILEMINSEKIAFHDSCRIRRVEPNRLVFENGEAGFDLLLAVPPHAAPDVIYECGLAKRPGFIPIDRDCKTPFERVFAVGDVTSMTVAGNMAVPKAGVFAEGEGVTVAKSIISALESKEDTALFDGRGGCFIESGRNTASVINVDMFSNDGPTSTLTESTQENLADKVRFEKERLSKWL